MKLTRDGRVIQKLNWVNYCFKQTGQFAIENEYTFDHSGIKCIISDLYTIGFNCQSLSAFHLLSP